MSERYFFIKQILGIGPKNYQFHFDKSAFMENTIKFLWKMDLDFRWYNDDIFFIKKIVGILPKLINSISIKKKHLSKVQ